MRYLGKKFGKGFLPCLRGRQCSRGQVLAEYALMLTVCAVFSLLFLVLLAACSMYGSRVISLVSWEPDPPSRSQMESIMQGKY